MTAEESEATTGSSGPPGSEPATITGSGGPYAPDLTTPLDTDDTRGTHFRKLIGRPWLISLGATLAIVAFVVGTTQGGVAVGVGVAALVALAIVVVVFVIASGRAKEDFFEAYATARGLTRQPRGTLPPNTPLLRKGDKRHAEQIMNGTLPGGLPGAIALYTYEEESTDSDGNRETESYRFTVVMHDIPAAAAKAGEIYCQRRSGFRWMDSAEDVFRRMQRLELESEALDKRFEIFYGPGDDQNWLKQLFAPSFVVWLAEQAPEKLAFELSSGSLCVNVKGHHDSASEFDELCEAASIVARRLADEATE